MINIPYPNKGESKDVYVARFMSSEEAKKDYPDEKQRVAVAYSMWKKHKGESDMVTFNYTVPITECEVIEKEGDKASKVRIGGVCLVPTVSRNGNEYNIKHIKENNGKYIKFFVQEHGTLAIDNVVGKVSLAETDGKLAYSGIIRNTKKHPDIVEHAMNKEIDVSIDARAEGKKLEEKDGKKFYSWEKIDIRALCGVGIGGVSENTMEYAIAESFTDENHETKITEHNTSEVNKLEELEQLKSKIVEMEKAVKEKEERIAVFEKENTDRSLAEKTSIIESIKKKGCKLKEDELNKKPISELRLILEYETKIAKESEEEGDGQVDTNESEKVDKAGIIVNESDDTVTMNTAKYKEVYAPRELYM